MKKYVVDIETDGLNPTVVHCIVAANADDPTDTHVWEQQQCYDAFPIWCKELLDGNGYFIGHNFISYDAPVLNRLTGTDIKVTDILDTLVMSYIHNFTLDGHSLEAWGERFGYAKVQNTAWLEYTPLILERCKGDVIINYKTFKALYPLMKMDVYWREAKVRHILDIQKANGFTLDIQKAMLLNAQLRDEADVIEAKIQEAFPPMWVETGEFIPKRDNRTLGYVDGCPVTKVTYQTFNLQSGDQVAKRLMSKGWKPSKYTDKGAICTDEGVLNSIDANKIPEAAPIQRFLMLEKRLSQITGWFEAVDDNYLVHGSVMTYGAVTCRMSHSNPNMANITAKGSEYGVDMRACWTVRDATRYALVGVDASGLELRCLAHHMGDTLYITEVVSGDVHTVNMNAVGINDRDVAKTFIYAWLYGAGVAKIAAILGCNTKRAKQLIEQFLVATPSLKALKEKVSAAAKSGTILALDGRLLQVRRDYAALNTLLQGAGAIICKEWLIQIVEAADKAGIDYLLVASIHDEYQFEVAHKEVDAFKEIAYNAMKITQKVLNVVCPLDSDAKVGTNWSDTH